MVSYLFSTLAQRQLVFRWREWCGLSVMRSWEDLLGVMGNSSVAGYSQLYQSVEDIDLWTAGISELPLPGSMVLS